jgi:uncharacterized membrane protein
LAKPRSPDAEHDAQDQAESPPHWEPIWQFRGHTLGPAEFTQAMLELYRAEQARSNTWRTRLDNTTYWAVITSLVTLLYLFASPDNHYIVLVLNTIFVAFFLMVEARRYRYYELWSYRVRLMETDFFAAMLVPPFGPHPDWADNFARTLLSPEFPISVWEAFGRRFRRNYMWLFMLLGAGWALKGFLHPTPAMSWDEFVGRFALGPISGMVMVIIGLIFNGALFIVGLATSGMRRATGEVLPRYGEFPILGGLREAMAQPDEAAGAASTGGRPFGRRAQFLTFVISSRPDALGARIMKDMRRGATCLHGKGVYSQQERDVLMVAVTVTEIAQLEQLVREVDPNAFVIVTPAHEVLGRGFAPLTP